MDILTLINVTECATTYFLYHFVLVVHEYVESIAEAVMNKYTSVGKDIN